MSPCNLNSIQGAVNMVRIVTQMGQTAVHQLCTHRKCTFCLKCSLLILSVLSCQLQKRYYNYLQWQVVSMCT